MLGRFVTYPDIVANDADSARIWPSEAYICVLGKPYQENSLPKDMLGRYVTDHDIVTYAADSVYCTHMSVSDIICVRDKLR